MAKWDLNKLPEGRKPLPDSWFAERAQMQERIKELETLLWASDYDAKEAEAYAGELEAKLAKAVEEAEKYQHAFAAQSRKLQAVLHIDGVRTTIAELTGGNDE